MFFAVLYAVEVTVNDLKGNRTSDFRKARDAYRDKLKKAGIPDSDKWPEPPTNSNKGYAPLGWSWHHHENGIGMVLVHESIHGNVRHCGGVFCTK